MAVMTESSEKTMSMIVTWINIAFNETECARRCRS